MTYQIHYGKQLRAWSVIEVNETFGAAVGPLHKTAADARAWISENT